MPRKLFRDITKHRTDTYPKPNNSRNLEKFREDDERIMEAYRLQNNGQKSIKLDKNTEKGREIIKTVNELFFGRNRVFQVEMDNNPSKQAEIHYVDDINTATSGEILDDIRAIDAELLTTIASNADDIVRSNRNTDDWYHFSLNIDQIERYKNNPGIGYTNAVRAYRNIETKYRDGEYNGVILYAWEALTNRPYEETAEETAEITNQFTEADLN